MNVVTISYHIENTKGRDAENADPGFIFNGSYSLLLNDHLPENLEEVRNCRKHILRNLHK